MNILLVWALMLVVPFAVLGLLMVARLINQYDLDQNRKIYKLSFPSELTPKQVLYYINSISGTLRPPVRFLGTPNTVFEVLANERGKIYRLWVPGGDNHYVLKMLRAHVPGITIEPDDTTMPTWKRIVELRQRNPTRPLRVYESEAVSTSVRDSMDGLGKGEEVSIQIIISPAVPRRKTPVVADQRALLGSTKLLVVDRDKIKEEREKHDEAGFAVGLRIAATAKTDQQAEKLIKDVRAALASTRTAHVSFKRRLVLPSSGLAERFAIARGPLAFQINLAASELAALLAWPIGDGYMPGVPRALSRRLPPSPVIPSGGRLLAHSNYGNGGRPITLSAEDACKHLYVVGPTGSGKTTLLAHLAAQDMQAGAGVIVIDSKGDKDNLFIQTLNNVPPHRVNDVVVVDVLRDQHYPVGFNILAQGSPQTVLSDLQAVFDSLYSRGGVRVPEQFFHGLMALMTYQTAQPLTFVDLVPLFSPAGKEETEFGDIVIRGMPDEFQRRWWQLPDNRGRPARDVFFSPVMERIWQLNNRPEIRQIIGQGVSTIDMRDIVRQRKILLVNLAGLGNEIPSLLGSMLVNALWRAISARQGSPKRPTFLYLDEFHKFMHLPVSLADMLTQARSFGLAMTLAHQNLGQLTMPEVRDAVLSNARSKVVFQSDTDTRILADLFGKPVTPDDIKHLGSYEVVMRVARGGSVSDPVTAKTVDHKPIHKLGRRIRSESRKRYGRPVAEVKEEIRNRPLLIAGAARLPAGQRPRLGPQPWDDD